MFTFCTGCLDVSFFYIYMYVYIFFIPVCMLLVTSAMKKMHTRYCMEISFKSPSYVSIIFIYLCISYICFNSHFNIYFIIIFFPITSNASLLLWILFYGKFLDFFLVHFFSYYFSQSNC